MMRLNGKVAIVTGGASGIGAATARLFAREGASVAIADLAQDAAETATSELATTGANAIAVPTDVSTIGQVEAMTRTVLQQFGRVDVLCNAAGTTVIHSLLDTSPDEWDRVMTTNAKGIFLCCKLVLPIMVRQRAGAVINVASNAGIVGRPRSSVYGASKAAVISLTKSAALEVAAHGVRVNCVCPGAIDTPMLRSAFASAKDPARMRRMTALITPLRRIGTPEDVANGILYLACEESAFVTGAALLVDGGRTVGIAETSHLELGVLEDRGAR